MGRRKKKEIRREVRRKANNKNNKCISNNSIPSTSKSSRLK
jgi:hypothetical protein